MKILFLARSLGVGGAERQLVVLANELAARGHEVVVATFYEGEPLERELDPAIRLTCLKKKGRWDLSVFRTLIRLKSEFRPDVIHAYLVEPNVVAALTRPWPGAGRCPVIWGIRASNVNLSRYDAMLRVSLFVQICLSKIPDLVIFNSEAGRRWHRAIGMRPRRTLVISNGIDTTRFAPDPQARDAARRSLGFDEKTEVVGLISRLDPMKDHETLLRAFASLRNEFADARLLIVGSGPGDYTDRIHNASRELGIESRVTWIPSTSDTRSYFNAMDVFCLSSAFGEGFPNVLAEAMACALPCVTTDVGDSAAIAGQSGLVVGPGDDQAMTRAIGRFLRDAALRSDMGQAARRRVVENFSVQSLADRSEAAMRGLVQTEDSL